MKVIIDIGVVATTLLMMTGVGLALDKRMLRPLLASPLHFATSLAATILVPAIVGLLVVAVLECPAWIASGILLVAACPVGDIANAYTLFARGNVAFSLTLHALTCLLAPLSMTLVFTLYGLFGRHDPLFTAPDSGAIVRLIAMILLPITAALAIRRWRPGWVAGLARFVNRGTGIGIVALLLLILINQWNFVVREGPLVAAISAAFILGCVASAMVLGRIIRLQSIDRIVLITCLPVRNLGIATFVAVTLLGRIEYAGVAAIYFLVEVPVLALGGWFLRRAPDGGNGRNRVPGIASTLDNGSW